MNKIFKTLVFSFMFLFSPILLALSSAENLKTVNLPDPKAQFSKHKDTNLLYMLEKRASHRDFSNTELSIDEISSILWSAYGLNRNDNKHTIPQSRGRDNMLLYVLKSDGVWLYNPKNNTLVQQSTKDIRTGQLSSTPLALAYVVDLDVNKDLGNNEVVGALHAGSMYQNVALYCSNANLGNRIIGATRYNMEFPNNQKVLIFQIVGVKK